MKGKLISLLVLVFIFSACENTESVEPPQRVVEFESIEHLLSVTSGFHPGQGSGVAEGVFQEKSFKSFAEKADQVYDEYLAKIESGVIASYQDVENYVDENKKYLTFTFDENGDKYVEKVFNRGYSYFMNEQRQISINNEKYVVFTNGLYKLELNENLESLLSKSTFDDLANRNFLISEEIGSSEFRLSNPGFGSATNECGAQKSG
ncbi:MAG: hypothetical protein RIF46_15930, partial [Cyclobacteriaceae bacterium]